MKNLLSPHEIATLFVVQNAPEQVALSDPDAINLQRANLVKLMPTDIAPARLTTTSRGRELLRRFELATRGSHMLDDGSYAASHSY